ncbi:hypothetical protein MNBD_ALPHA01-2348 [hydrothermal vent metagenome]|uniref:Class I SAM-dependent methyltransferase n=1 Tax=hydrothermal vent metagenome TaxID=652676 RepID=A0A3B0SC08_9ZZZZ
MIFELLRHFLTPAPPEIKAMGYVHEAIAIEARYNRCHTAWASHLARCRLNILAAVKGMPPGATIMIIGSGALHDVPMDELLSAEFRLILVDIVHLPKIHRLYRSHDRVQFIEQDVSGYVKNLYEKKILLKTAVPLPQADLVISLNILSQLPLKMVAYAEKYNVILPDGFARDVMEDHLKLLGTGALLISDLESDFELADALLNKKPIFPDFAMLEPFDEWDWVIAPKGELEKDFAISHRVGCWHIYPSDPDITLNSFGEV